MLALLEYYSHRQGAKSAKELIMTPSKTLGEFDTGLANLVGLAVQNEENNMNFKLTIFSDYI